MRFSRWGNGHAENRTEIRLGVFALGGERSGNSPATFRLSRVRSFHPGATGAERRLSFQNKKMSLMTTNQGTGGAAGATISPGLATTESGELHRAIDWRGAFWVAAGVPPLVLFSIGGIAGTTGKLAFLVWIISMIMGFLQSFTYAEIAGMFGNKSGGASVYGATAWLRYSKFIAPLSVLAFV